MRGGVFLFTSYSSLPTVALAAPALSSWGLAAALCALSCSHDSASWHPVVGHTGTRELLWPCRSHFSSQKLEQSCDNTVWHELEAAAYPELGQVCSAGLSPAQLLPGQAGWEVSLKRELTEVQETPPP